MAFISGFRKGLLRQVMILVGLIASFMLALLLAGGMATYLNNHTSISYTAAMVLAFTTLFIDAIHGMV